MRYEPVIGLEVHAELSTKSKIFCSCSTAFGAEINTHVCPVCTGQPGALPVLNKQVVHYAAKMGVATHCRINRLCKSDRKNYFYPDLPKAYQISQFDVPICEDGYVDFEVDGEPKRVRFERIHFEEVTKPDIHSSAEAKGFLEMVKTTLSYLNICDCRMEEGSIRCDVNVSIRPYGTETLGTRVEMKNINSFSAAVRAIDYEVNRQIDVLEDGGTITQETRRWDDAKGKNLVMRTKEDAQDYRYFPDPDLVAVEIDDEWMHQIESEIPELPQSRYARYMQEIGLQPKEARIIADAYDKACLLDDGVAMGKVEAKAIANWILSDISKYLNDKQLELKDTKLTVEKLVAMIELIEKNIISGNAGKKVLIRLFETDETVDEIVEALGLKQVSDEGAIQALVDEVLAANPKSVEDYKKGKKNVVGFLVGQCMKASKGKGNPKIINQLLAKTLETM